MINTRQPRPIFAVFGLILSLAAIAETLLEDGFLNPAPEYGLHRSLPLLHSQSVFFHP